MSDGEVDGVLLGSLVGVGEGAVVLPGMVGNTSPLTGVVFTTGSLLPVSAHPAAAMVQVAASARPVNARRRGRRAAEAVDCSMLGCDSDVMTADCRLAHLPGCQRHDT